MNTEVMFSSESNEWETPQDFFDNLNKKYKFTLDVCATNENKKCNNYFSIKEDGLSKKWTGVCWMNPPYGRDIKYWIRKAFIESQKENGGVIVVALLPARTDTKYFHEYIYNKEGVEIEFIKGRLKFGGHENPAPFPSMVVVFKKNIEIKYG